MTPIILDPFDPSEPSMDYSAKVPTDVLVVGPHNQLVYNGLVLNSRQQIVEKNIGTNLVTNPRAGLLSTFGWASSGLATFETVMLDGVTHPDPLVLPDGSTIDTAFHAVGNSSGDNAFDSILVTNGLDYALSVYVYTESLGGGADLRAWIVDSGGGSVAFDSTTTTGTWLRLDTTAVADETADWQFRLQQNLTGSSDFYFTAVLVEQTSALNPYFDGGTQSTATDRSFRWTGTPHESISEQVDVVYEPTLERYYVEDFTGFEDSDLRISEDENPQEDGSTPGPGFYGSRVMGLSGFIEAGSYPKLLEMDRALQDAFLDLREKPLLIEVLGGFFTQPDVQIYARKADKLMIDKKITQTETGSGFLRKQFTLTLKASDPTYRSTSVYSAGFSPTVITDLGLMFDWEFDLAFDQLMDPQGNPADGGNSLVLDVGGNWPALPVIRFTGYMAGIKLTNNANGHFIRLNQPIVDTDWVEVNVMEGTILDSLGVNRSDYFDTASDWMRLVPGVENELVLSVTDFSGDAQVLVSWQTTRM